MSYEYQKFASLPVNLNRQAYGALDISQVFTNENDLKYYVSKGAYTTDVSEYWFKSADEKVVPYPYAGQYLALVDNETRKVTAYILEERAEEDVDVAQGKYAFSYKEVGITPVGDDKTIDVDAAGKITVHGIEGKTSGTYVPQLVNGELVWSAPSNITVDGLNANLTGLTQRVTNLEDKDTSLAADIKTAQDTADANAEAITALQAKDVELANADTALDNRLTTVEQTVNGTPAQGTEGEDGYVAAVPGLVQKVADLQTDMSEAEDAISNRYTKDEVHTYVAQEIGKQAHFSAQVVTSTNDMTDTTTLYLLKKEGVTGSDVYEQYIVLTDTEGNNNPTLIGETSIDLTPYATDSDLETAINGVTEAYEADDAELQEAIDALQLVINGLDAKYDGKYATIETVNGKADQTALDATNQTVSGISDKVTALEDKAHTHENESVLEGITEEKVSAWDEAEKNVIHSANSSEFTVTEDRQLNIKEVAQSKITGLANSLQALQDGINGKVSKEDGKELISSADLAKLVKLNADGTLAATNVTGLADWTSANRETAAGLMSAAEEEKLAGIAAGAQVNVIEGVSVAGEQITPTNKIVEISSASNTVYGVVKGTAAMNMVSINEDKAMEVHSLNVTKLVQDENTVLILNGGNA